MNITLHGAATYGALEGRGCENMTETQYLRLVLGPQRQDDQVGGVVGRYETMRDYIVIIFYHSSLTHSFSHDENFSVVKINYRKK